MSWGVWIKQSTFWILIRSIGQSLYYCASEWPKDHESHFLHRVIPIFKFGIGEDKKGTEIESIE